MDGNNFFEFKTVNLDVKNKAIEDRKKMNLPSGRYVDNSSYKFLTGEDVFDFEDNKRKMIDNLNWLKSLCVEEFTFRKKWEEIQLLNDVVRNYYNQAKSKIWIPTDIYNEELTIKEIESLRPKVVVVSDNTSLELLWTTLRYYCSTAEYNQAPGRFIKFLMIDENSDKILGISSIASDVISISDRDKFIGWNAEDKLKYKMLRHSAIGTTIVPTQPFGSNFLGGKLIASMITSDIVRNQWENTNNNKHNSSPCKLVAMTTTSLYGSFSMYNSLKWWKPVGQSKGKIPIKPYEESYENWHGWLKQHMSDEYEKSMTQKEGVSGPVTGAKMRVLSMIFKVCGIKQSDYCHGYSRGIYWSEIYENSRDFLCRKITEDKLIIKPLFKGGVDEIVKWWKPRAIQRYLKLKSNGRINNKKLFYNDMYGMTYEEAKNKYYNDVGR